jgi:hypothetical protein
MFEYGATKVIPVQFPQPSLETLLTPVGDVSMQGLMWTFVGASPPYQIFTGVVELLAGLLLILPWTTTLGAAIALASMLQVLVMNLSYDVGVKMMSFNLVLMNLVLLAPALPRLANFLVLNRPAAPSPEPRLFTTARANRRAAAAQVLFGLYLLGVYTNITWRYWQATDPSARQPPLHGIWDVEALSINGETRPVLQNEYDRQWRRVVVDEPGSIAFQRFDDSFATYGATIDPGSRTIALRKGASRQWKSTFVYEPAARDGLILEGDMEGDHIRVELRLVPADTFRLLNSHFRWVRPPDP